MTKRQRKKQYKWINQNNLQLIKHQRRQIEYLHDRLLNAQNELDWYKQRDLLSAMGKEKTK